MSELTKWLPLFEKCPALWPPYLRRLYVSNKEGTTTRQSWAIVPASSDPNDLCEDRQKWKQEAREETVAALIRDRAVQMIGVVAAKHGWQDAIRICNGGTRVESFDPRYPHVVNVLAEHPDPTEALRLAVCKVMGVEV